MRILILALSGLLSVSTPSFGDVLTTDQKIRQAIIGNTVSGNEDGKRYVVFFLPDGSIHGQGADGAYSGEWRISRRRICVLYSEDEGPSKDWECMHVEVTGSRLTWIEDGERYDAQLVPGNPNRL